MLSYGFLPKNIPSLKFSGKLKSIPAAAAWRPALPDARAAAAAAFIDFLAAQTIALHFAFPGGPPHYIRQTSPSKNPTDCITERAVKWSAWRGGGKEWQPGVAGSEAANSLVRRFHGAPRDSWAPVIFLLHGLCLPFRGTAWP